MSNSSKGLPFAMAGHRIRHLRDAKGLSRRALAEVIGVDVSSVVNWETGKHTPRDDARAKLAHALGCDAGALLTEEHGANSSPLAASTVDTETELPKSW